MGNGGTGADLRGNENDDPIPISVLVPTLPVLWRSGRLVAPCEPRTEALVACFFRRGKIIRTRD